MTESNADKHKQNSPNDSTAPNETLSLAAKPIQKPHSWPELIGLVLIAGIAVFVILSIEKIAVDLDSYGQSNTGQSTIQLERVQLRLESVRKIMQLGTINAEENTLMVAHHEVKTILLQLNELLPQTFLQAQPADITNPLAALKQSIDTELTHIESLLRTGSKGFMPTSAPVLRLILHKIDGLLDSTQSAVRATALIQSANAEVQSKLLKDFSEYSTLFLTIFGLFAAGLLGLALYQRQLFSNQLNANQLVDVQTRKLHDTIEGFSTACAIFDEHRKLQTYNSEFQRLLPESTPLSTTILTHDSVLLTLRNGDIDDSFMPTLPQYIPARQCEKNHELHDYKNRNLLICERPTQDGGMICTYRDVTYIHHTESRLKYLDNHDKLTQLPNRNRFLEDLSNAIATATDSTKIAVVIFDIHNFRDINDTYGHSVGDKVLQLIAGTIHKGFRPGEYAARIGGDEFASIIGNISNRKPVEAQAGNILEKLRTGFNIDNLDIPIRASIGIAYYPNHGKTVTGLINNADAASMYAKKNALIKPTIYNNKLKHKTERRRLIEREMHRAIDNDELRVQYQPQIDVQSGLTTGMEALIRWNNAKLGEISPAEFIPLAEDNGLIIELGEWVLKRSISDYQQVARYGMSPGVLSINLSRRQFNSRNIASTLETAIGKAGMTPQQLTMEITETAIMDDTNRTAQILNELKEMGVGLSIDDFGVGYSSFAALREFPIDEVKIDRLFITDVVTDKSSQEIIRAIIDVAHALNAEVVAEGIENRKQFEMIKYLGCHRAQGYFLCEPVEATTFPDVCLGGKTIPNS